MWRRNGLYVRAEKERKGVAAWRANGPCGSAGGFWKTGATSFSKGLDKTSGASNNSFTEIGRSPIEREPDVFMKSSVLPPL